MYAVIEGLYLGTVADASAVDSHQLDYADIHFVLSVVDEDPHWKGACKNKLKCWVVQVCDLASEDLLTKLPSCVEFIHEGISQGKNVLVHW